MAELGFKYLYVISNPSFFYYTIFPLLLTAAEIFSSNMHLLGGSAVGALESESSSAADLGQVMGTLGVLVSLPVKW